MARFRRIEIIEPCSSLLIRETSIFSPKIQRFPYFAEEEMELSFALNFLNPNPFEIFDTITDVTQMEKTHFHLQSLCDRVSALESRFDQLAKPKTKSIDRKYTWTAEIKDGTDRKYKWTAEIKGAENKKKEKRKDKEKEKEKKAKAKAKAKENENEKHKEGRVVKNLKWTTEIKGKGLEAPICKTYTFKASSGNADQGSGSEKKDKKNWKKRENDPRVVEIEETGDHGVLVLRQAFAKRAGAVDNRKGKKKELSPQDAALMIQMSFRAYLLRRSQALRGLRELAMAKTKLKDLRALFNNFSYRRRIASDAAEHQRFSEKIIVLLLTVDAIQGADLMVRGAKRSMVDELEAMLDVIDPQPGGVGRCLSMKRRMFDLPSGGIQKDIAAGVAQVVRMLDRDENGTSTSTSTFEACM